MGGGLMYAGSCAKRVDWVNFGAMVVLLAGIALVANVLDSLSGSGLVLIVAGLVMLGLVWLLEKQRRVLAKSIREGK
jgi:tetrahydromethanopterin S-methyltransferase subunit E